MSRQVQLRRGTAAEHTAFAGAVGELTVVTDDHSLRLHDGATPGGWPIGGLPDVVAPGAGAKVQIDAKGRVVALLPLGVGDLPDLPMAKVLGLVVALDGLDARIDTAEAAAGAAIPLTQKGALGGVVPLGPDGKIDGGYLPAIQDQTARITVADDAARLALPVSGGFRIVLVTATGLRWSINPGADPANPASWDAWADSAGGVDSFAGRSGAVTPQAGDYAAAQIAASPGGGLAGATVAAQLSELAADLGALETEALALDGRLDALEATPVGAPVGATIPSAVAALQGSTASPGSSAMAARADHVHLLRLGDLSVGAPAAMTDWVVVVKAVGADLHQHRCDLTSFFTQRTLTGCVLVGGDAQQTTLSGVREKWRTDITSGASFGMSGVTAGNAQKLVLTQNFVLTLPNVDALIPAGTGYSLTILVVQDAIGGRSLTIDPPAGQTIDWGETGPTQPRSAASAKTLYHFYYLKGSNQWFGGEAWR